MAIEPRPRWYKNVIVNDGHSLYGSIISTLGTFVNRSASATVIKGLCTKIGMILRNGATHTTERDVISTDSVTTITRNESDCMRKARR